MAGPEADDFNIEIRAMVKRTTHFSGEEFVKDGKDSFPRHPSFPEREWHPSSSHVDLVPILVAVLFQHRRQSRYWNDPVSDHSPESTLDSPRGNATSLLWNRRPRSITLFEIASSRRSGGSSRATITRQHRYIAVEDSY